MKHFPAYCLMLILSVTYSCSNTPEDSTPSDELLYSLGLMPDVGLPIPLKAPEYSWDKVSYIYLAEKGLPLDSVIKMRGLPTYGEIMPLYDPGVMEDGWPLIHRTIDYLSTYNVRLWEQYIKHSINNFPIISRWHAPIYYWDTENGYRLALVCYYIEGRYRVIYGEYDRKECLIDYNFFDEDEDEE